MNIKHSFLLPCLLLLSGSVAIAQEEPVAENQDIENQRENQSERPSEEQSENQNENTQGDTQISASEDEDFVPSIQISEDLSVSFPVDI